VKVTSIWTLLLPQSLKQSGSVSGMWASPGSSPPSKVGNDTVAVPEQAGEHPRRKLREAGFSLMLTASKGSDGTVGSVAPEKRLEHVELLTNGGRSAHSLRPDGPAGIVPSTLVRKSYA
jgi:hypothetical protein